MAHKLLIVDDEANVISSLKRAFINEEFEVFSAISGLAGLELLAKEPVQVIISDEKMPGMSGAEFLSEAKRLYPHTIRFMLTGQASIEAAMKAINEGEIYRFFTKPWDDLQLIFAIRSAFERSDLEEENRRLLETVKRRTLEMKSIEKFFPGITDVKRDDDGKIMIDNLTQDEMLEIIQRCERDCLGLRDETD
ncbi:MAG: response regulator [Nitrospirae bacterium]|nr:response regulator [Nitrospirota bacterium]